MRNALKIAAGCLVVPLLMSGCEADLTEYNPSGLTPETVFSTPEGFESLVNAAYSYARWWYGKEDGYSISEIGTDLWMSGNGDTHPTLTTYESLLPTELAVDLFWEKFYTAINLINAGVSRIGEAGLTEDVRSVREAELRFLRAFYYWHIVETWGGVHFSLEETTGVQTEANRTPVETFYEQIFEDLEFAVANLPETTSDYGRITKPAAEAFLARIHLTRGNDQQALDLAEGVIDNYGFALEPNYADLWSMDNLENPEIVWAVNYSVDIALNDAENDVLFPNGHPRGGHNGHLMFLQLYDREAGMKRDVANGRPFNRYMPTSFLLDLFDEAHDSRYAGSFGEVWFANSENNLPEGMALGDTAIYITKHEVPDDVEDAAVYNLIDRSEIYNPDGSPVQRGNYPDLKKFKDPTRPTIQEQVSGRDAFVIRLAEMYLIAAEAQLNLGNRAGAAESINVLRERAAIPGHEAEMMVTPGDITLDFILDERARELAGEQLRWFDLKRTGKLVERVRQHNPDASANIQDFHVLRPIPQRQLDAVSNKDEFTQNTGY